MTRDDGDWEITSDATTPHQCKHCAESDNMRRWKISRAVQAWNEGGYNFTIVCLDCILEAAA